jgi:hypothetical protein
MSQTKIGRALVLNRDIFISLAVAMLFVAFLAGLYSIFGMNLTFAFPLLSFFYKLFSMLAIIYAIVIIAANRNSKKIIIYNYSLLALYSFAVVLFLAFIIVTYYHFEMSINGIVNYAKENFRFPSYTRYFLYMIYFSQFLVMVFFLISLISRTHRIGFSIIKKNYYVNFYSNILDYVYGDKQVRYNAIVAISKMLHSRFSKEEFVNTLNMFNVNFKGELRTRIYDLYKDSRMDEFLHATLDSRRNSKVMWAIKMLSSFNDSSSIPALKRMLEVHNDDIRFEVIIGLIKLNQIDFVLDYLYHSSEPINEYISNKIVSAIKLQNPAAKDYGFLLESKNDGVLIMGLNLVNEFVQEKHFERVKQLLAHPNVKVSYAAIRTLMTLDCIDFEKHIVESIKNAPEKNKIEMVNAIRLYFTEDSLLWAKDLLFTEPSREVRMAILRMMSNLFSQPEIILDFYDETQRSQVQELLDSITKTTKK